MRLIKLKARNIASLKGEHIVDFESIANQSPLFAITGETGAGKSTLLNCIGLALYGKIYKPNVQQNDVVTIGEKEGVIELIFEAKGKSYLANWRARVLKANGEPYSTPQSPIRELYLIEGKDFHSNRTITLEKVDEILNLDYEQFCKCVILNQGEFARFLNSSFNDRKDILEKLYPGEVLESLSRELKLQTDTVSREKNQLDIEAHTLKGDAPDGEVLKNKAASNKERLTLLEQWQKLIETLAFHYSSVRSYHRNFQDYINRKALAQKEYSAETTVFNSLLKKLEEVSLAHKECQALFSSQEPILQQLIEKEIAFGHLQEKLQLESKKRQQLETRLSDSHLMAKKAEADLAQKQIEREELSQKLKTPLETLLLEQNELGQLFESWSKQIHLQSEVKSREASLIEVETKGKELAESCTLVEKDLALLPANLAQELDKIQHEKKLITTQLETRQKAELKLLENEDKLSNLSKLLQDKENEAKALSANLDQFEQELAPIKTSLKLQEILTAVRVCLSHEESRNQGECPVCQTSVSEERWQELQTLNAKNDFAFLESKANELEKSILMAQTKLTHIDQVKKETLLLFTQCQGEKEQWNKVLSTKLPSLIELEAKTTLLQKQSWDFERLTKEKLRSAEELNKIRGKYKSIKQELSDRSQQLKNTKQELEKFETTFGNLTDEIVKNLREDAKILQLFQSVTSQMEKLEQQLTFTQQNLKSLEQELEQCRSQYSEVETEANKLKEDLTKALGLNRASEQLGQLRTQYKAAQDQLQKCEADLKLQEKSLKEFQSKIYLYDDQIKQNELLFEKEIKEVRENASQKLPLLSQELATLVSILGQLGLTLKDPEELFAPISDMLSQHQSLLKQEVFTNREEAAATLTQIQYLENKLDKIKLLELKLKDLQVKEQRLNRLSEVLGKDELRSFVLSLVEENLIRQTNQELQRLCQGRYEIIHQNRGMRLTPEFYILDKFREGGRRKVSTLSGGETFMVSLALALGLAEMTRGQAEIDSLFIDEGFGTLDQESLEDVLEMLGQIQTRGLMVGVISHIKALTQAVPVNLVLNKKNDGTSTISQKYN